MRRTLSAAWQVTKRRGIAWPALLAARAAANLLHRLPRGLIVEPTGGCTGHCSGCTIPDDPAQLSPEKFRSILESRASAPVTIHFAGKHSDPLASPFLPELVQIARRHSAMVSVSTIGLGLIEGWENLPVDRWIVSIPAATGESWFRLRGNRRFGEIRENIERLLEADRSMVELVLTLWKHSENDIPFFEDLVRETGTGDSKVVFGRFDPEGYHMGRLENLALGAKGCPYEQVDGGLKLKSEPAGCPLSGTMFLDASGLVHPCPFTVVTDEGHRVFEGKKNLRKFPACRYCP